MDCPFGVQSYLQRGCARLWIRLFPTYYPLIQERVVSLRQKPPSISCLMEILDQLYCTMVSWQVLEGLPLCLLIHAQQVLLKQGRYNCARLALTRWVLGSLFRIVIEFRVSRPRRTCVQTIDFQYWSLLFDSFHTFPGCPDFGICSKQIRGKSFSWVESKVFATCATVRLTSLCRRTLPGK